MNTTLIAIDPGASGGISILRDGIVDAISMPETPKDICDWITAQQMEAINEGGTVKCFIEKVGGYVGGAGQPGSAMFQFGYGVGTIHGILITLGIPFEAVTPQRWQKALGLGITGKVKGEYTPTMTEHQRRAEKRRVTNLNNRLKKVWKLKLKAFAQQLNPHLRVTNATADALCILEFGRRQERLPQREPQQGALV